VYPCRRVTRVLKEFSLRFDSKFEAICSSILCYTHDFKSQFSLLEKDLNPHQSELEALSKEIVTQMKCAFKTKITSVIEKWIQSLPDLTGENFSRDFLKTHLKQENWDEKCEQVRESIRSINSFLEKAQILWDDLDGFS
jgi:uncharacterized protein YwqG